MPRGLGKSSPSKRAFNDLLVQAHIEREQWKEVSDPPRQERLRKRAFEALRRQRFIETRREGDRLLVRLTDKGLQEALRHTVINKRTPLPRGEYCYVSFDLPESVRSLRDAFRLILKEAGFTMIHQSLWYCRRDIGVELAALIELLDATAHIHVFQGRWLTAV